MLKNMKRSFKAAIICLLSAIMIFSLYGNNTMADANQSNLKHMVDNAGLLDQKDVDSLEEKLNEISNRNNFDVIIVTVNSTDGAAVQDFADDYYDYNGYGKGTNKDGALLLINMDTREWHISRTGYGITALTDAGCEYMADEFLPDLKDGKYKASFNKFAELCDKFVQQAKTGKPYDVNNMPKKPLSAKWILYSFIIALIIALIICETMRRNLKSIRRNSAAAEYVKKDSMNLEREGDYFLYRNVSRREKPKNNDGGGSSTHKSSSGTTHAGTGGSF